MNRYFRCIEDSALGFELTAFLNQLSMQAGKADDEYLLDCFGRQWHSVIHQSISGWLPKSANKHLITLCAALLFEIREDPLLAKAAGMSESLVHEVLFGFGSLEAKLGGVEGLLEWCGFFGLLQFMDVPDRTIRFELARLLYREVSDNEVELVEEMPLVDQVFTYLGGQVRRHFCRLPEVGDPLEKELSFDLNALAKPRFFTLSREAKEVAVRQMLEGVLSYDIAHANVAEGYSARMMYYKDAVMPLVMDWLVESGRMALWQGMDHCQVRRHMEEVCGVLAEYFQCSAPIKEFLLRSVLLHAFVIDAPALRSLAPVSVEELSGVAPSAEGEEKLILNIVEIFSNGITWSLTSSKPLSSVAMFLEKTLSDAGIDLGVRELIACNPHSKTLRQACLLQNDMDISPVEFLVPNHIGRMTVNDALHLIDLSNGWALPQEEQRRIDEIKTLAFLKCKKNSEILRVKDSCSNGELTLQACIESMKRFDLLHDLNAVRNSGIGFDELRGLTDNIPAEIRRYLVSNGLGL